VSGGAALMPVLNDSSARGSNVPDLAIPDTILVVVQACCSSGAATGAPHCSWPVSWGGGPWQQFLEETRGFSKRVMTCEVESLAM
jgi:hypothetical protein